MSPHPTGLAGRGCRRMTHIRRRTVARYWQIQARLWNCHDRRWWTLGIDRCLAPSVGPPTLISLASAARTVSTAVVPRTEVSRIGWLKMAKNSSQLWSRCFPSTTDDQLSTVCQPKSGARPFYDRSVNFRNAAGCRPTDPEKRYSTQRPGFCFAFQHVIETWNVEHLGTVLRRGRCNRFCMDFLKRKLPIWCGNINRRWRWLESVHFTSPGSGAVSFLFFLIITLENNIFCLLVVVPPQKWSGQHIKFFLG